MSSYHTIRVIYSVRKETLTNRAVSCRALRSARNIVRELLGSIPHPPESILFTSSKTISELSQKKHFVYK